MTTRDNDARLQDSIRNTIKVAKEMEIERRAKAEAATGNVGGAENPAILAPRQVPESRIAELLRLIQAEDEFISKYDADFDSEQYTSALIRKARMEQELFSLRPRTSDDALAAIQVIQHSYLEDRVCEELSYGVAGVLNLLGGLADFIRQQAR